MTASQRGGICVSEVHRAVGGVRVKGRARLVRTRDRLPGIGWKRCAEGCRNVFHQKTLHCIWKGNPSTFASIVQLLAEGLWQLSGRVKLTGSIELVDRSVNVAHVDVESIIKGVVIVVKIVDGIVEGISVGGVKGIKVMLADMSGGKA